MAKETIQYQELLNVVRSMKGEDELFYFFLRACENGSLQICQICLDAGADINICEHYHKETLLIMLVRNNKFTTEVGDWFIEKGANLNITNICDETCLSEACRRGNFEAAKYFIDKKVKIRQGQADLISAVYGKNVRIVKLLLELGVDLEDDSEEYEDSNPYIEAIITGQYKIVKLFLQKGVSPDSYYNSETPLHMAVKNRDIKMANTLLTYNANVNAKLKKDNRFIGENFVLTAMDIAVLNQDSDMQKLLTAFGGTVSTKKEKMQALTECDGREDREKAFQAMKEILES